MNELDSLEPLVLNMNELDSIWFDQVLHVQNEAQPDFIILVSIVVVTPWPDKNI